MRSTTCTSPDSSKTAWQQPYTTFDFSDPKPPFRYLDMEHGWVREEIQNF